MTWTSEVVSTAELVAYLDTNAATIGQEVRIVAWNVDSVLVVIGTP